MTDRTEQLIREAFAAEAEHAPESRVILARLARARARSPRRRGTALVAAAAVVAVAVAAVAVPKILDRNAPATGPADENVLLLGLDGVKKAELMMLAHLDADGTASVVSLPDGMPRGDGSSYSLSEVYRTFGPDRMLADVEKLTGQPVDHYVALDMAAFGDLATAVGGVPVCLREATKDPETGVSFPAGTSTVAGDKALNFLRQNDDAAIPYPDFLERQQSFLAGLASKAGDVDPRKVRDALGNRLRTDKDLDLLGLADRLAAGKGVRFEEIFEGLDIAMEVGSHGDRGEIVIPLVSVRQFVADMFAGASHPGGPRTPDLPFTKQTCVY
jgi:LCP family protein required for cell wall assembly